MALTNEDLAGLEIVTERRPEKIGSVTVSHIPETLVKLLVQETPKVLTDKNYELIIRVPVRAPATLSDKATAEDKAAHKTATEAAEKKAADTVKQLCLYAVAWGKGQSPRLYIRKIPNRTTIPDNHARLAVKLWDDVPPQDRPGRKQN
jgi:hypothetical protein